MSDPRALRNAFGKFASGVTVVSCHSEDGVHGATVSAFTSVSLDPPLLQVTLIRGNRLSSLIPDKPFTVSVLAADQSSTAMHFAGRPDSVAPEWDENWNVPAVAGASAIFSCVPWAIYDGGDHIIVIGEIADFDVTDHAPLVFHSGALHMLGESAAYVPWLGSCDYPHTSWFGDTGTLSTIADRRR